MKKKKIGTIGISIITVVGAVSHVLRKKAEEASYTAELMEPIEQRKQGIYERYVKRGLDVACATGAIICFAPVYLGVAALVKLKLGSPVLFTQERPGMIGSDGKERIFKMYKFRTMTDERDENGEILSDDERLTKFGAWLRSTSLDELPEAFNILNGTMSVIGPRPQLIRDMVFMTNEQRMRHTAKPGLSGLAQINGRNDIDWKTKIEWDFKYIQNVNFLDDVRIIINTIGKAIIKKEGITEGEMVTSEDYGDYLFRTEIIDKNTYLSNQDIAKKIKSNYDGLDGESELVSIVMPSYNTAQYISDSIQSVINQTYEQWELIIVDDCSTDNTDEVVKPFLKDGRITYLKNEKNSGAAMSRNRALKETHGRWIAFLDSDDLWAPEKLEKQVDFMEKNGYCFSYTKYSEIDMDGNKNGIVITGPKTINKTSFFNYCWPGCLTVMYDFNVVGLIQVEDIKKNNDYAMWLKVCRKVDCYLLDENLASYRRGRAGSVSTQNIRTMIWWHYKLFKEAEGQNIMLSLFNTGRNLLFGYYKKKKYRNEL